MPLSEPARFYSSTTFTCTPPVQAMPPICPQPETTSANYGDVLCVTVAKLWPRCGHGTPSAHRWPHTHLPSGGGLVVEESPWPRPSWAMVDRVRDSLRATPAGGVPRAGSAAYPT